jgi:hypothetical protein
MRKLNNGVRHTSSKLITKRLLYCYDVPAWRSATTIHVGAAACWWMTAASLWSCRYLSFDVWIGPAAEGGGLGARPDQLFRREPS